MQNFKRGSWEKGELIQLKKMMRAGKDVTFMSVALNRPKKVVGTRVSQLTKEQSKKVVTQVKQETELTTIRIPRSLPEGTVIMNENLGWKIVIE